jgi:hypothetical protein
LPPRAPRCGAVLDPVGITLRERDDRSRGLAVTTRPDPAFEKINSVDAAGVTRAAPTDPATRLPASRAGACEDDEGRLFRDVIDQVPNVRGRLPAPALHAPKQHSNRTLLPMFRGRRSPVLQAALAGNRRRHARQALTAPPNFSAFQLAIVLLVSFAVEADLPRSRSPPRGSRSPSCPRPRRCWRAAKACCCRRGSQQPNHRRHPARSGASSSAPRGADADGAAVGAGADCVVGGAPRLVDDVADHSPGMVVTRPTAAAAPARSTPDANSTSSAAPAVSGTR